MRRLDPASNANESRAKLARRITTFIALTTAFGLFLGTTLARWQVRDASIPRRVTMVGTWIKAPGLPGYVGHFRRQILLPGPVKHAWISLVAREGFEVCVNSNPVGRFHQWRPTRPFQTGLSEVGQVLDPSRPLLALNFPREYQWASHRNEWFPVFLDITPHLVTGRNALSVQVESRRAPAALRLDGEILLWSGERLRIDSGGDWRAEPVPPWNQHYDWNDLKYPDYDWRHAVAMVSPSRDAPDFQLCNFDQAVLTTPFAGSWLRHAGALSEDVVWFRGEWQLPQQPATAWVRLATDRAFDLFVNGHHATPARPGEPDLDSGDWIRGTPRGADMPSSAELLDPDEAGSLFIGDRFESPRHAGTQSLTYKPPQEVLRRTGKEAEVVKEVSLPGTYDPVRPEGEGIMHHDPLPPRPEQFQEKSLGRDRSSGGVLAYEIRSLLKSGTNTIEVRLAPPLSPEPFNWAPQIALDGSAVLHDGSRVGINTGPATAWRGRVQDIRGTIGKEQPCSILGPAQVIGKPWPAISYRGIAPDPSESFRARLTWISGSMATTWLMAASLIALAASSASRRGLPRTLLVEKTAGRVARYLLLPTTVLAAALLVECSWAERHEIIFFHFPEVWPTILLGAFASPLLLTRPLLAIIDRLARLPESRAWSLPVGTTLILCGILRIYGLDFQPLDDDEYASCQAIVAIAQGGTPAFVPDGVYYTRSPLYHYLIGGIAWICGINLWSMRMPSAIFGMATALITYRMATRFLRRPWVGLAAMFFLTIHPYAIFSSHLVRFYQQQQFFSMLAVYWFCRGFVGQPVQRYRYLTILAFLAAVFSQEMMVIMLIQITLGLIIFGRDAGWPNNIRLSLVVVAGLALVAVDLLIFQTWCLTRTEGVSPYIEASLTPHFWDPYNLLTLLLGYSRLHLVLSIILVVGTPMLVLRGGRIIWVLGFFLLTGVLLTNLFVTHVSFRYQYWMLPLLLILSFRSLGLIADRMALGTRLPGESSLRPVAAAVCAPLAVACFLSFSPWRIAESYDTKILNDSTGAFRFVRANLRYGDAVAATEPHPHAAYLETGFVTYDLSVPVLQDFVMLRRGRLIDRNGGAEVIGSLQDLMAACQRHDRLWVVVNREKLRNRGSYPDFMYPGGRLELYLRSNFEVAHKTYLWTVFLWDRSHGRHNNFRGE